MRVIPKGSSSTRNESRRRRCSAFCSPPSPAMTGLSTASIPLLPRQIMSVWGPLPRSMPPRRPTLGKQRQGSTMDNENTPGHGKGLLQHGADTPQVGGDSDSPLLVALGVSKSFGGVIAVDNVDFAVGPGESIGLVGPNGAGKTRSE